MVRTNDALADVKSRGPDTPMLVSRDGVRDARRRHGGQQARCTEEIAYER